MISAQEVQRSLKGAVRLSIARGDGLDLFERSFEALWRSFFAMVLVAPIYLLHIGAERRGVLAAMEDPAAFPEATFLVVSVLAFFVDWLIYPLAMIPISRALNVGHAFGIYITAFNWTSVIAAAVFAPPYLLASWGIIGAGIGNFLSFAALVFVLHMRWFVARTALGVAAPTAAALVLVELLSSLLVALGANRLAGVGL